MMDKNTYRGKRKDNGEWDYGHYITDELPENAGKAYIAELFGHDIDAVEVIPETVGQCTGLPDKNGKAIFEGDIVVSTNERRLSSKPELVKYSPVSGYWQCYPTRNPLIIGNIHDNPEILEEE